MQFPSPPTPCNDPLTPADTDFRGLPWMRLYVGPLTTSKAWLQFKRNPAAGFYFTNLMFKSFHQVPAGSVEDDDDVLADLAMCHPDEWSQIKPDVLKNWKLCPDGRWHCPLMAEAIQETKENMNSQRSKTAAATAARCKKRESAKREDRSLAAGPLSRDAAGSGEFTSEREYATSTSRARSVNVTCTSRVLEEIREEKLDSEESKEASVAGAIASAIKNRGTRIASDWMPTQAGRQLAIDRGLDLKDTVDNFKDYWKAKSGKDATKQDWDAAFRVWCRNEKTHGSQGQKPRINGFTELVQRDEPTSIFPNPTLDFMEQYSAKS